MLGNQRKNIPSIVPQPPSFPKREPPSTYTEALNEKLMEYRFLFVVPVLLPASYLFNAFWKTRTWVITSIGKHFRNHEANVKYVQDQIKKWKDSGSNSLLCTARPHFLSIGQRHQDYKQKDNSISLPLYDILKLDTEKMTVTVEPGVSVGQLTQFLNPKKLTIPVVPELDDLTFGGLMNGYGIESSSHKFGLFNDNVVSAEVVLGDASVVKCSETENEDLFRALPWSHGSLGFIVSLELKIIPCAKYIRLTYEPMFTLTDMVNNFTTKCVESSPKGFVEAIQFDYNCGILTYGDFADEIEEGGIVNAIGSFYKPWWHKHCQGILKDGVTKVEYIPTRDYYHRHTKSIFWEMELILPMGNHPIFRYLLGWLMPPSIAFLKGTQTQYIKDHYRDAHIAQDYLLPISKLKESIKVSHELYDIYPLWLCPHAVYKTSPQGSIREPVDSLPMEMYVDLGIWYAPGPWQRGQCFDGRGATKKFEKWLRDNRGYQATYAETQQNCSEYYQMFDDKLYRSVREKYGCEGVFMDSFDKVHGRSATKREKIE